MTLLFKAKYHWFTLALFLRVKTYFLDPCKVFGIKNRKEATLLNTLHLIILIIFKYFHFFFTFSPVYQWESKACTVGCLHCCCIACHVIHHPRQHQSKRALEPILTGICIVAKRCKASIFILDGGNYFTLRCSHRYPRKPECIWLMTKTHQHQHYQV